eukprot:NODE_20438_length_798_cov_6.915052.p2 GENE.NODE_20438_length_798_cov_6.915052~~NODE_20438_length_798_cov_6.915052.p2  ORF type:complete len:121 (-),score=11.74 NODE_20438_length_798_cov_6.915052:30-392(-)
MGEASPAGNSGARSMMDKSILSAGAATVRMSRAVWCFAENTMQVPALIMILCLKIPNVPPRMKAADSITEDDFMFMVFSSDGLSTTSCPGRRPPRRDATPALTPIPLGLTICPAALIPAS